NVAIADRGDHGRAGRLDVRIRIVVEPPFDAAEARAELVVRNDFQHPAGEVACFQVIAQYAARCVSDLVTELRDVPGACAVPVRVPEVESEVGRYLRMQVLLPV